MPSTDWLEPFKKLDETQIRAVFLGLDPTDKFQLKQAIADWEIKESVDDLPFFLKQLVYTLDEHDQEHPIKPLPMHKPHLQELAQHFLIEKLLVVEKSRQMMVTWLMIACLLWDVMFHEGRRVFIQSKKESDAAELLNRMWHIYDSFPEPHGQMIRSRYPANKTYTQIAFNRNKSFVHAVPEGAHHLRQFTASRIFIDEAAFQPKLEEAIIASKPTVVGGGQLILVSTPNFKETFYLIKSDEI